MLARRRLKECFWGRWLSQPRWCTSTGQRCSVLIAIQASVVKLWVFLCFLISGHDAERQCTCMQQAYVVYKTRKQQHQSICSALYQSSACCCQTQIEYRRVRHACQPTSMSEVRTCSPTQVSPGQGNGHNCSDQPAPVGGNVHGKPFHSSQQGDCGSTGSNRGKCAAPCDTWQCRPQRRRKEG